MNISDYIRLSIDEADRKNLEPALMHVCAAVDGTAKKLYRDEQVGKRMRRFIRDNIDIIGHFFGGPDLALTIFPFPDNKGKVGVKFEDIIYNNYRCKLMHGDELGDGWGVEMSVAMHVDQFSIDLVKKSMTMPQSVIYALGMACVLSDANTDQRLGKLDYFYKDLHHLFYIDDWWGKLSLARQIIYFNRDVKVIMDFQHHMKLA